MSDNLIHSSAFVHPQAIVEPGARIGAGTRVWAFSHILGNAVLGEDCNICDHTFIEGKVSLGNRVTVKSGVYLWDELIIEDDVFIGPAAVFTNDRFPRSKKYPANFPETTLRQGCSIGANSVILPGLEVGRWSMTGAGSVVTRNVKGFSLVVGNPSRVVGWVCKCGESLSLVDQDSIDCSCGSSYRLSNEILLELSK